MSLLQYGNSDDVNRRLLHETYWQATIDAIAIVSGMCFYASVLMATTPAVKLELQILNAIFLGILCGIGMLYFRLMPERMTMRQRYMQILGARVRLDYGHC